jgi:cytochrome c biogenesis protein CcmG/thiol:disulfide interchange protein DsbE
MNKRWILALTAVVGLGLLAVPLFVRSRPPQATSTAATNPVDPPSIDSAEGPKCADKVDIFTQTLKDANGAPLRLADYKGKVVLLNFWATWCAPCKVEIPEFVDLYAQYKDRGLVILGVLSQDTPTADQLQTFIHDNKMQYPVTYPNETVEGAFGELYALPTSFLISRDGAVCAKQLGAVSKEGAERSIKALL